MSAAHLSRLFVAFGAIVALFLRAAPAGAADTQQQDEPAKPRALWRAHWPSFSTLEGVATVTAGAGVGVLMWLGPAQRPRWQGGILFDDAVRRGLRLDSAHARQRSRSLGDLPYYAAPLLPLIVDPLVAWLVHEDTKAALNLELMGFEAFAYAGLLSFVSTHTSARERPDSLECRTTRGVEECEIDTESFWSGHTSIAAASAGLVCANHAHMRLWGNEWADAGACLLATTGALVTGISRITADRHYTTDVLAGFGAGFGVGYAVPTLLHYSRRDADVSLSLSPGSPCTGACLQVAGSF